MTIGPTSSISVAARVAATAASKRRESSLRGQAIGKAGDEGIDGVISEDRLGLDIVYLQAKKWDGTVGRTESRPSRTVPRFGDNL
jgi:restriction endonuclease Mrr